MRSVAHATVILLIVASRASAQGATSSSMESDPVSVAAASRLNAGRGNEARILLQRAALQADSREMRALYRLRVGDSYLHDGQYQEAMRTYESVLSGDDAKGDARLTSWAHRGLGLADAFLGRRAQAAAHMRKAIDAYSDPKSALRDSIQMLMVSGQHDAAAKALEGLAASGKGTARGQDLAVMRALNILMSGHCTAALEELTQAQAMSGPVSQAIRGQCASKRGRRAEASALRDSVLSQPMPDPFAWDMLIARDIARRIPWR